MKIILASASPRRKELLHHIFPAFEIIPANGEENAVFTTPSQYVSDLALSKAAEIACNSFGLKKLTDSNNSVTTLPSDDALLIIGADTIVYSDNRVLGKPADAREAEDMLRCLSGKMHSVYTGVSLLLLTPKENSADLIKKISFSEETHVYVSELTSEEIREYIQSKDCFDKAGSYGIQGMFSKHIDHIDGDYFNVVGLPVSRLYREIRNHFPQCLTIN